MQSQNTCLHTQKPATNKRFNGLGFSCSSHLPRFEGVWWPVEGGEVTLNGKAARFHFWLQAPSMPGATKQRFVFVFHETCARGRGGHKQYQRHCPSFRWEGPGHPRQCAKGSHGCLWPQGVCISAWWESGPQIGTRGHPTAGLRQAAPIGVTGGPVSRGCAGAHIRERPTAPSAPNIISSCLP